MEFLDYNVPTVLPTAPPPIATPAAMRARPPPPSSLSIVVDFSLVILKNLLQNIFDTNL